MTKETRDGAAQLVQLRTRGSNPVCVRSTVIICESFSESNISSSAMLQCGVDLDDILTSAGWSSVATFQKFYNRSVEGKPKEKQPSGNSLLKYFQRK